MQSPKCQRIIRDCKDKYDVPVLIVFLKEWQDGYDPHFFSKANRGSVWVKTITISEPHDHKNESEVRDRILRGAHNWLPLTFFSFCFKIIQFTYAIALGPVSSSHEEVEQKLAEELEELSNPQANI